MKPLNGNVIFVLLFTLLIWGASSLLKPVPEIQAPYVLAAEDYEAGRGAYLDRDYAEALRIWQPLGDAGKKLAQFSLGGLYFEGAGVERDYAESAKWFQLAADQGYAPAYSIAVLRGHRPSPLEDATEALKWAQTAWNIDVQFDVSSKRDGQRF